MLLTTSMSVKSKPKVNGTMASTFSLGKMVDLVYWKYFFFFCVFCLRFRFFLMYLINKDVTEHTGQVQLAMNLYWKQIFGPFQSERCVLNNTLKWETTDKRTLRYTIYYKMNCDCCTLYHNRNHTCGRCSRNAAGSSFLLETVSGNSMKINSAEQFHVCNISSDNKKLVCDSALFWMLVWCLFFHTTYLF